MRTQGGDPADRSTANGYNRGLSFDPEMLPYCGTTRRVERRVDRIIDD